MNKKHIKVAYTSRLSGGSYTQVPKIQMEGRWLEELGFSIGMAGRTWLFHRKYHCGRIWGRFPVYPPDDRNGIG